MSSIFDNEKELFNVVINGEEQFSIWPQAWDIPSGWKALEFSGVKKECLDYIEKNWTDMRPLSLRKSMSAETT